MKTKTQLKNTNSKRSIAMKKAWARRRKAGTARVVKRPASEIPGVITARVAKTPLMPEFAKRPVTQRVTNSELYTTKEWQTVRRMLASNKLDAMIQSAPMCDRSAVDEAVWAKKAVAFADALLVELDR